MTVNGANGTSVNAGNGNAAVNGYTMIQIDPDGGWFTTPPHGDIVEVDADGSWGTRRPEWQYRGEADGSWEQTGENGGRGWKLTVPGNRPVARTQSKYPPYPSSLSAPPVNPVKPAAQVSCKGNSSW